LFYDDEEKKTVERNEKKFGEKFKKKLTILGGHTTTVKRLFKNFFNDSHY